jgi:glycine cleavage system H protein
MWTQLDSAGQNIVGIDTLGLESLGDLAYISLQATGMPVKRGESIGVLEAAKMTGDVIAPVSGMLMTRNKNVLRDPTVVNSDPYGEGWLVAIKAHDWEGEADELIHGPALPAWVESEVERYRSQGWID